MNKQDNICGFYHRVFVIVRLKAIKIVIVNVQVNRYLASFFSKMTPQHLFQYFLGAINLLLVTNDKEAIHPNFCSTASANLRQFTHVINLCIF